MEHRRPQQPEPRRCDVGERRGCAQKRRRLCAGKIEIGEQCCKWEYLEPGEGYGTSHSHPECYQHTLDAKWDEGDWECMAPGDIARPNGGSEPRDPNLSNT